MRTIVLGAIKNFFFPSFCAFCKIFHEQDTVLCADCTARIRPIVSHTLAVTKTKSVKVIAVGAYDQPLVSLILAKSSGNRTVASQLGELAWQQSVVRHLNFDLIVPIPLHWSRYAWRGYNQADEIARVISKKSEKPIEHLLKRVRRTAFQSYFKGKEREVNVANVFQLKSFDKARVKDKHLLLVDDVMTSGATLKEAARELFALKPSSITVLVLSRVA